MTLKNSFFNLGLLREGLRRNLWAVALTLLALFCALVLPVTMTIQNAAQQLSQGADAWYVQNDTLTTLQAYFNIDNAFLKIMMTMLAIVCGTSLFSYLHSRQQIDFHHSLPIRRETIFCTNYVLGLVIVLPIYLVMVAIAATIASVSGYSTALGAIHLCMATDIVFFIAIYTISVLCTILCGNRIITLLLLLWAMFSIPSAIALFSGLCSAFFQTYNEPSPLTYALMSRTSPIVQYFSVVTDNQDHGYSFTTDTSTSLSTLLLGYLIATALLLLLSFVLFKHRKSERAGSAIAFYGFKVPLKLWCVTLMAVGIGLMFHEICDTTGFFWLYFGLAFGGVLTHFLMEIIYAFDFKAIFSHMKTLVIYAALFAAFLFGMQSDLTSFDRYLPAIEDLSGVRFSISNDQFYTVDNWEERNLQNTDNMQTILQLASYGIAHNDKDGAADASDSRHWMYLTVTYLKSNGMQASRQYNFPYTENDGVDTLLEDVIFSQEYITKCTPAYTYTLTGNDVLKVHTDVSLDDDAAVTANPQEVSSIIAALRKDSLTLTPQQAKNESPVLCLELASYDPADMSNQHAIRDYNFINYSDYMPVYASYTDTLQLLEETLSVTATKMEASDVASVSLSLYDNREDSYSATVTDAADIAALLQYGNTDMLSRNTVSYLQTTTDMTLHDTSYQYDVLLNLHTGASCYLYYTQDHVPTAIFQKYFPEAA